MDGLAVRFVQLRNGYNPLEGLHTASVCLAGVKYIDKMDGICLETDYYS